MRVVLGQTVVRQNCIRLAGSRAIGAAAIPSARRSPGVTVGPVSGHDAAIISPVKPPVPPTPPQSEADAYWATQPAAVQALRTITDYSTREATAEQLVQQGYKIDYQIMVAQWDPLNTMSIRKFYGYTWVPAMGQPGIPVVPGMTFPGEKTYDPNSPPPGSITVSTDFAMGKTIPSWEAYNAVG